MSAGTKDYYEMLGVGRDATDDEIKKAFRRRARETHPDVNKASDAETQFKAVNEAYDVLSDPQKRRTYDQYGTTAPGGMPGGGVDFGDVFSGIGMEDLFSAFFGGGGGGGGRRVRTEGRDMAAQMSITLDEAFSGVTKEIAVNRMVPCDECSATGSTDDGGPTTCPDCQGTGQKQTYRKTFLGTMQTMAPCDRCGATGSVIENPCPECTGQGRIPDRDHVEVKIPAGIQDGMQISIRGRGEAGVRGAPSGDLLVEVRIQPHEYLHRQGDDLHCRMTVSIAQAALGADLEACSLEGDAEVKIPAGAQHGDTERLKGQGMPHLRRKGRGDLIVHVAVQVPRKLSKRQKELLTELGDSLGDLEQRSPLEKLKDWISG